MAAKVAKMWIAIIIIVFITAIALIGKMSYDSGVAFGRIDELKKYNDCLDSCTQRVNLTIMQYKQSCLDICLNKGIYNGRYDYPPFPF